MHIEFYKMHDPSVAITNLILYYNIIYNCVLEPYTKEHENIHS